jgi:hypothetical protein
LKCNWSSVPAQAGGGLSSSSASKATAMRWLAARLRTPGEAHAIASG